MYKSNTKFTDTKKGKVNLLVQCWILEKSGFEENLLSVAYNNICHTKNAFLLSTSTICLLNITLSSWKLPIPVQFTCVVIIQIGASILRKRVQATWVEGPVHADLQGANIITGAIGLIIAAHVGKTTVTLITLHWFTWRQMREQTMKVTQSYQIHCWNGQW